MTDQAPPERPESRPVSEVMIPEAKGELPTRSSMFRKVLLGILTGAIFALILIKVIPSLASYGDIWAEVRAAPTWQILAYVVIGFVIMGLSTAMMVLPIRGIGAVRAFLTQQGSTAISFTIPGPSGTGMRFLMLRSYGVDVEDFSRGTVAVSLWNNVCMLGMPGVAVLLFVIMGHGGDNTDSLAWFAIIAVAVTILLILGVILLLRSEGFARWCGRAGQAMTNWCLRLFRKTEQNGWEASAVTLRSNTMTVLKARGLRLTLLTLANYWLNGVLLVLCLRLVGIDSGVLPWGVALATYTVGRLSTVIQITPGGVGVVEVAYTAAFVAVIGSSYQAPVTAGVLIYRGLTYLMPIIVGAFCYLAWRFDKGRGVPVTSGPLDEPASA
jgi:uncharacterized protein (TIRG00374 family)